MAECKRVKAKLHNPDQGSVTLYEDGTIARTPPATLVSSTGGAFIDGLATKDIDIPGREHQIRARVYVPEPKAEDAQRNKLPLVIFFLGGGFCLGSPAAEPKHRLCSWMAVNTRTVWVSVDYRLAPEHRLPAALEDAKDVLKWVSVDLQSPESHGWDLVTEHADIGRCVVVGESSGASLAYLAAVDFCSSPGDRATEIVGTVLIHPGFLKPEVSRSEKENPPCKALMSVEVVENALKLFLTEGSDRGHFVLDPPVPDACRVKLPPTFAVGGALDIFHDTFMRFCRAMEDAGQEIEIVVYENMGHSSEDYCSPDAVDERRRVAEFVRNRCLTGC